MDMIEEIEFRTKFKRVKLTIKNIPAYKVKNHVFFGDKIYSGVYFR